MANEFKHKSVGTELTQTEFEAVGGHVFDSQATGDIPYAVSSTQISRLGIGSTNDLLTITGGIPAWSSTLTVATIDATTDFTIGTTVITDDVITFTPTASDTVTMTAAANGAFSLVTVDAAAAAANIQITADGTVDIDSAGVLTLDSGAAINIEPATGSAILLDGTISIDAGVVTGATSITSTAFVGDITGDVTGNADTATLATTVTATANNSTDETVYPTFVDGATSAQGIETDTGLTYNPSSGALTSTSFVGAVTGTATVATSVTASANNSTDETVYPAFVDGATGTQGIETDTGLTYNPSSGVLTSTSFTGNVTGDVTGNASGTAATVTSGTQASITTVANVVEVGALDAGSITSGFGAIDNGSDTITTTGLVSAGSLTVTGTTTLNGNLILGDAAADTLTVSATIQGATPLVFEGASAGEYETSFAIADPSADRTITFPDLTGTVALTGVAQTWSTTGTVATGALTASGDTIVGDGYGLVVGHSAQVTLEGQVPEFQILGTGGGDTALGVFRASANAYGPRIQLSSSRSASIGSFTIVQDDDVLGTIAWAGDDGVDYATKAATIEALVDGTPGSNDMPTRLVFATTADGASDVTEALRIDSAQNATFAGAVNIPVTDVLTFDGGANGDYIFSPSAGRLTYRVDHGGSTGSSSHRFAVDGNENVIIEGAGMGLKPTYKLWFDNVSGSGDTYIYEESADDLHIVVGGTAYIQVDQDADSIAIGPGNIWSPAKIRFVGAMTSDGTSDHAYHQYFDGVLTGAGGDTDELAGSIFVNSITTQTATESIAVIAQVKIHEPAITDNLTGDITIASSLYIKNAPTEGETNAAIYVAAGDVMLPATGKLYLDGGNNTYIYEGSGDNINFHVNDTHMMKITTGGVTSYGDLTVASSKRLYLDGGSNTYIWHETADQIDFVVGDANDMRLQSDGDLHVEGDVIAYSSTIASDIALKENITTLPNALETINRLRGVSFDWKREDRGSSIGVIAQEVEKVFPELIDEHALNGMKTVNYSALIGVLIEAVKELSDKVEA